MENDLHTAAVTTNAAFDLVRQAEAELIAQASGVSTGKRTYESIAMVVFYEDAFQQDDSLETRLQSNESLQVTTFDDFVYLSTAKILMKFTYMADLAAIRNPNTLRLAPVCPEANSPPSEDEFGQNLGKFIKQGLLSAALVTVARIYLDIQDIMGDNVGRGYKDLVRNTIKLEKIMNLKVVDGAWELGRTGERWLEKDTVVVMRIKQTSIFWILDNPANAFPNFKEYCLASNLIEEQTFLALPRPKFHHKKKLHNV
ncbi:MAG: hypothetical protein Q9205_000973 [Flavoplaca limonia]